MNNSIIQIRLPEELKEELKAKAKEKSMPVASLIRMILSEYLKT